MLAKRRSKARFVGPDRPQKGRSNIKKDKARKAKRPGARISKSGRKYSETRKNRSDKKGRRI